MQSKFMIMTKVHNFNRRSQFKEKFTSTDNTDNNWDDWLAIKAEFHLGSIPILAMFIFLCIGNHLYEKCAKHAKNTTNWWCHLDTHHFPSHRNEDLFSKQDQGTPFSRCNFASTSALHIRISLEQLFELQTNGGMVNNWWDGPPGIKDLIKNRSLHKRHTL